MSRSPRCCNRFACGLIALVLLIASASTASSAEAAGTADAETGAPWPAEPPADAVMLFDGTEAHQFLNKQGERPNWPIEGGAIVSTKQGARSNHMVSRLRFRDAEIHVEFQLPPNGAGNSGVYIHGHYELQIIAPKNPTVLDDHTLGAIYGFSKPLVAAGKPRDQWQTYDIRYHAPRRGADGAIEQPARISAWLNGQKVQSDFELFEPRSTYHPYRYQSTDYLQAIQRRQLATGIGPLFLQDHDNPVRFRNVWVRPLDDKAFLAGE